MVSLTFVQVINIVSTALTAAMQGAQTFNKNNEQFASKIVATYEYQLVMFVLLVIITALDSVEIYIARLSNKRCDYESDEEEEEEYEEEIKAEPEE